MTKGVDMTKHSDTPDPGKVNRTLAVARMLGNAGYLVFPCRPFSKMPATKNGFKDASNDYLDIDAWFDNDRGYNLAVACGPQPNGVNLLAVDIDPKNGGNESWKALTDEHGVPLAPRHETPSDGFHVFFDVPDSLSRTGVHALGAGIDTRGDGGYVVVPPSQLHNDDGEIISYRTSRAAALAVNPPHAAPLWLMELLDPEPLTVSMRRHPSQQLLALGDSVADKAREGWDWFVELEADGWTIGRGHNDEIQWTRPGKNPREGTSATLHRGGPLVVWSTSVPTGGVETRTGTGRSYSPWDYIVTFRAGGDTKVAAALVRGVTPERAEPAPPSVEATSLNLPASFWEARPILAHIRQAAWSAGCSPDALFVQALARVATYVHPCFKLPGVEQGLIGKHQTLDFLGCVVAETSGGKTLAAGVAELLVPAPDPPGDGSDPLIDFEQRVGSGEGIAEFFLVPELKPDDEGKLKATGKRVIGKQALFMNVDEGTGFTNQAGRKGTTIIATLASAWSGESLGQLNAADETRRLVRGGRVRICAVINMQDTNGYKLYAEDLESVGFTGRLMFASAHDPAAPSPSASPDWPGPLSWPIRSGNSQVNVYFTYDPAIVAEIKNTRHGILTRTVQIERRQSQYLLLRCKVAALLAVMDGRISISLTDWSLATEAISMSSANLCNLDAVHSKQGKVAAVTAASFKLDVAREAESMHVRQLKIGWQARIVERLRKRGPLPWKGLKDLVDDSRRADLRACLEAMVDDGAVVRDDAHYRLG